MAASLALSSGRAEPLGVTPCDCGINVAVFSAHATSIELCLFDDEDRETARIALRARTGDIHHGHVAGLGPGARYGLRAHGPFAPREGHRFNPNKLLLDPHAALIDRPFVLHPSMFGYHRDDPNADLSFDEADSAPFMPKGVVHLPAAALDPGHLAP
jgi:pullulanase/glycogen debranching enzyme